MTGEALLVKEWRDAPYKQDFGIRVLGTQWPGGTNEQQDEGCEFHALRSIWLKPDSSRN
jgi:hypothetical protein